MWVWVCLCMWLCDYTSYKPRTTCPLISCSFIPPPLCKLCSITLLQAQLQHPTTYLPSFIFENKKIKMPIESSSLSPHCHHHVRQNDKQQIAERDAHGIDAVQMMFDSVYIQLQQIIQAERRRLLCSKM